MSDDGSDRARLQAVAFGPGDQTADERAAAAARLQHLNPLEMRIESEPAVWVSVDSLRSDRDLRRPFVFVALFLIAVLATIASMGLVGNQENSLAVFDRPEAPGVETPSNLLTLGRQLEARRLTVFDTSTVWATRGYPMRIDADRNETFSETLQVCLIVVTEREYGSGSWGTCVDETEFRQTGIELEQNWRVEWGPTGPVRVEQ